MLTTAKLVFIALLSLATVSAMSSTKDVIISFEKSASDSDRDAAVKELEGKGATIVKDQNKHSKIMPYVVVNLSEQQFSDVQSSFAGHAVVKNVEEDKEMRIQS